MISKFASFQKSLEPKYWRYEEKKKCVVSDTKIIQTTWKSNYFAFIGPYKGKVTGFSSSLDDFSVRHNPLVFSYLHYFWL